MIVSDKQKHLQYMTMEQAMSMLMTGGAVGPETLRFSRPVLAEVVEADGSAGSGR